VMLELNILTDEMKERRLGALEATALLQRVMGEIDVAVFAFDQDQALRLVNASGARLLAQPAERLLGRRADELGLGACLQGDAPRVIELGFPTARGRWEVRRGAFRQGGRPHQFVVLADVSRALREEERRAWQRLIRVFGHEINNSLTPIKSIAHSIRRMIARAPEVPRGAEIQEALTLIETRSGALGRFLRAYAQLARLPKPQRRLIQLLPIAKRIAELEDRVPITIRPQDDVWVSADADQIEQLLINIVRNAADATVDTGGSVWIDWATVDGALQIAVEDEGPGLPDTSNLFVPFFTTKPTGSGIGLALSRQIAEAHGGTLTLENRREARGCRAVLRLPV
jgi:two-component system, NtrC family, nitrogen regulation sensor histidine kinase NtrY